LDRLLPTPEVVLERLLVKVTPLFHNV
jgi:hypothetical protein